MILACWCCESARFHVNREIRLILIYPLIRVDTGLSDLVKFWLSVPKNNLVHSQFMSSNGVNDETIFN